MFLRICHLLNRCGLSWLVAAVRFVLVWTVALQRPIQRYPLPEQVGYFGWVDCPGLGVLAFRRMDGTLQYRW